MTPDEVRLLDNRYAILFIRGERPVLDLKYDLLLDYSQVSRHKYEVFLRQMGIAFLESPGLFDSKDIAVVHLDSGVLFNPLAEGGLGNAVFLAQLCLGFAVLMEGYGGFLKILIIFVAVICRHKSLLFRV